MLGRWVTCVVVQHEAGCCHCRVAEERDGTDAGGDAQRKGAEEKGREAQEETRWPQIRPHEVRPAALPRCPTRTLTLTHTHSHTLALAPVTSRFTQSAGLARTKLGAAGAKLRRSKAQTAAAKQRRSQIRQFECVVHSTTSARSPCPPLLTTARVPSCGRLACRYDRPQKLVTVQLRRRTAPPFATLTEVKAIVKDVRSGGTHGCIVDGVNVPALTCAAYL